MSVLNLDALLNPKAVAIVGASTHEHAVGNILVRNLLGAGFEGQIFPVNPAHKTVEGLACYPDIASLPDVPDMAVICTPAHTVPGIVTELGNRGTTGAVVISAGFKELSGAAGTALETRLLEAAQPHLLRIIGPNCLGVLSTSCRMNASFAHLNPAKGGVAFLSQSGAMMTTMLDWAADHDIGFSYMVSLGDMADVDFGDLLKYLADNAQTKVILLYVEAITHADKFLAAARAAAAVKPVIVLKSGRHSEAAKAAHSHTGALAGSDEVYDAAFRRCGLVRVYGLEDAFDAVEILTRDGLPEGERIAILTNGGGAGVLAADALLDRGATLAEIADGTLAKLDAVLPATWSRANPADIIGDATPERYAASLKILLEATEIDWVLVQNCPTAVSSGVQSAEAVITTARSAGKTVLTNWLGAHTAMQSEALFQAAGIPHYSTPDRAARAFSHVTRYRRARAALAETADIKPPVFAGARENCRRILDAARASGAGWLPLQDVTTILGHYGIATPGSLFAADISALKSAAARLKTPLVLKIQSADIVHKSDVGGVMLGLADAAAVQAAAQDMLKRVARAAPNAKIEGFLLQETVDTKGSIELIAGMTTDPTFGPVMLFGRGGKAVEVVGDKALALAPLNRDLAEDMIRRTRIYRELAGYRDQPPMNLEAIAAALTGLSALVGDCTDIAEVEINPLLATASGIIALDGRLRLHDRA